MEELTIAQHLKGHLPRLKVQEELLTNYEEVNPFNNKYQIVDKNTYIGIECEVENAEIRTKTEPYWNVTQDGSLRNQGLEFTTLPIKAYRVEQALYTLFNYILTPRYVHSERCSTHIHINVRTLTLQQLETLVLTYMIFEKALFNWVKNGREKNIFCVPLYDITLTQKLSNNIQEIYNLQWSKYTALNLKPILTMGTIEFRHLHGTSDIKTIITWINLLLSLKKFVLRNKLEYIKERIYNLNTKSDYFVFCREVFDDLADMLYYPELSKDMSYCITNIKSQAMFIQPRMITFNKLKMLFNVNPKNKVFANENERTQQILQQLQRA